MSKVQQVFVKALNNKSYLIDVDCQKTKLKQLMSKISQKTGHGLEQLQLVYAGKILNNGKEEMTLSDIGIMNLSTIFMVLRLKG